MYFLLFAIMILAVVLVIRSFLHWTLPEVPDDNSSHEQPPLNPATFYNPRSWAIFRPIPLISYRRDKKGRFRKMP